MLLSDDRLCRASRPIGHFRDEFEYHATHPTKVKDPKHFEKEPFKRVSRPMAV